MGAPADIMEAKGTYTAPRHGWVCFHCGEEFSVRKQGCMQAAIDAAAEHFGADPRWSPACIELLELKPRKLYRRMRLAEARVAELAGLDEGLDYHRTAHHDLAAEVKALRDRVDSLEGELEVERLRLREAR